MKRRIAHFIGLLAISWVIMTFTHECGHLLGGFVSGATLTDFDVVPWRLPYSLHAPDPHPLVTLWAGPLFGVAAPGMMAALIRRRWAWFIADFCLIANGCYLAVAWISGDRYLDTARLLDAGAHPGTIVGYCIVTVGVGYARFRKNCMRFLVATADPPDRDEPLGKT